MMRILSIETSCDETSIALVEASGGIRAPKFNVLKNIVSSQIAVHIPFGGVVPNLAKREHIKNLPKVLKQIFNFQFSISNLQKKKNQKSQKSKLVASGYTLNPKIIYGGSVNSVNVGDFLKHKEIDGVLVGGASLKPEEIKQIVEIGKSRAN